MALPAMKVAPLPAITAFSSAVAAVALRSPWLFLSSRIVPAGLPPIAITTLPGRKLRASSVPSCSSTYTGRPGPEARENSTETGASLPAAL